MQEIATQIKNDQNLLGVEDKIVPVKEIFRLQDDQEIAEAEKIYLTQQIKNPYKAIILAASRGKLLGKLTEEIPKTLIKVGKYTILESIVNHLHEFEIKDITVVAGFKKEKISVPNLNVVANDDYESTGQLMSLSKAIDKLDGDTLIVFGDILFKKHVLRFALEDPEDVVIVVDSNFDTQKKYTSDFVKATEADNQSFFGRDAYVTSVQFCQPDREFQGEWIGVMKLGAKAV